LEKAASWPIEKGSDLCIKQIVYIKEQSKREVCFYLCRNRGEKESGTKARRKKGKNVLHEQPEKGKKRITQPDAIKPGFFWIFWVFGGWFLVLGGGVVFFYWGFCFVLFCFGFCFWLLFLFFWDFFGGLFFIWFLLFVWVVFSFGFNLFGVVVLGFLEICSFFGGCFFFKIWCLGLDGVFWFFFVGRVFYCVFGFFLYLELMFFVCCVLSFCLKGGKARSPSQPKGGKKKTILPLAYHTSDALVARQNILSTKKGKMRSIVCQT